MLLNSSSAMARNGPERAACRRLLSGAERTSRVSGGTSDFDPNRTCTSDFVDLVLSQGNIVRRILDAIARNRRKNAFRA